MVFAIFRLFHGSLRIGIGLILAVLLVGLVRPSQLVAQEGLKRPGGDGRTLKMLIVGDSHMKGDVGAELSQRLIAKPGLEHWIVAAVGSSPYTWTSEFHPKKKPGVPTTDPNLFGMSGNWSAFGEFLGALDLNFLTWADLLGAGIPKIIYPDIVVVCFGSNMAKYFKKPGLVDDKDGAAKEIKFMVDILEASQVKWMWLGPPQVHEPESIKYYNLSRDQVERFAVFLKTQLATFQSPNFLGFVDGRPFTADAADGLHFLGCGNAPNCGARAWAQAIADLL